jgi:putative membrane protein
MATETYQPGEVRDRLANERTLLAWLRTSIALSGFGLALAKVAMSLRIWAHDQGATGIPIPDYHFTWQMGVVLVILGGLCAGVGAVRTTIYARAIDPENKRPRSAPLLAAAIAAAVLSGVLAAHLLLE